MSSPRSTSQDPRAHPRAQTSLSLLAAHLRTPLYREGYALVLNYGLTALLGVAYWLIAARTYSAHYLGLNSAAISAMMFLAGVAQLNLMSALTRFVPVAGNTSTRLVLFAYLLAASCAATVALIFLAGLGVWAPALGFLTSSAGFIAGFTVATMAWCVFNLQDSVLTALRSAVVVPLENLVYSAGKIVLLVALVGVAPHFGIFASWTAALVPSLVGVNLLVFARLLPRHVRGADPAVQPPTRRDVATYLSADYLGSLFWLGSMTLMPVLVVSLEGPTANAYFSLAWMIALPIFALAAATGASLVVTASRDHDQLAFYARRVLIQTAGMAVPVGLALALAAPLVLRLFGAQYAEHSAATLSLLALAAIPNVVTILYVHVYRVRRQMRAVVAVLGSLCGLALALAVVLLQPLGIIGVGVGWLVAELLVASVLLIREPRALWPAGSGPQEQPTGGVPAASRPLKSVRDLAADLRVLDPLVRLRHSLGDRRRARQAKRVTPVILADIPPEKGEGEAPVSWTEQHSLRTVSDVTVITAGPPGGPPRAVVKLPVTSLALQTLEREREMLRRLHADTRLDGWAHLLPTVLADGQVGGRRYLVQRMLPGSVATSHVGGEGHRRVQGAAVAAIAELHRRTAKLETIDALILERWIDEPALAVRAAESELSGGVQAHFVIDRLVADLHRALEGRSVALSWVHGDFTPNNILVSSDGRAVLGIVDWDQAARAQLPSIDVVGLLLATRALERRREHGHFIQEFLRGARWTEQESALLEAAHASLPGARIDSRTLVLVWWLKHVSGNLGKSHRYTAGGWWWRANIQAVLDTLPSE